ncbi:MAG: c-type cytochrome [Opitutaceae bacterium]
MTAKQRVIALMFFGHPLVAAEPAVDDGRKVFAACAACHAPDQPTRTGPDLRGVFGRKAGTAPGFRFSRALQHAKIVWNEATLDAFLAEPQAALPGNTMPYPGLPDAAQRGLLIAYLKTLK